MMKSLSAVIVTAFVLAPHLTAQSLAVGTWTGTMTPPQKSAAAVTYEVTGTGDSLAVTMVIPGHRAPFSHIRWVEGKLLFEWTAGDTLVKCELSKQGNGGYRGPCTDAEGGTGQLDMVPPAKP